MDPYSDLGVQKGCSDEDVKKSYRKLVMKHHPDKGGDPEQFKKIQGAYEILSDPQKRQNFDQFGNPDGPQNQGFPGGFGADIFSQMFGGNPFQQQAQNQGFTSQSQYQSAVAGGFSNAAAYTAATNAGFTNNATYLSDTNADR